MNNQFRTEMSLFTEITLDNLISSPSPRYPLSQSDSSQSCFASSGEKCIWTRKRWYLGLSHFEWKDSVVVNKNKHHHTVQNKQTWLYKCFLLQLNTQAHNLPLHLTKVECCQSQSRERVEQVNNCGRLVEQEPPVHQSTGIPCRRDRRKCRD